MVYKKYVTRGGKKFGPYYFKSVREKDGRVRSVYLGTEDPSRKNLSFFGIFFLVALLFLVGFLGMFAYQGFQVAEISVESSEDVSDSVEEDIVDEEIIEEEIVEEESEVEKPIEEAIIEEEQDVIDEEINETEDEELEGDIEINETGVNETEDEIVGDNESIEINETGIDLNESESNVSEEDSEIEADGVGGIIVNGTNETKVNLSEPINESLNITKEENQTFLDPINESYETTLNNSGVVINQPVRWEKRIKLKERKEIYNVDLPEDAFDVEFYEVIEDEVIIESGENAGNLITGNIVFDFFKNIFSFTGKVTYEINDETIVIRNTPKEFLIEYSTPGPTSKEIELNQYSKKVVVNGEKFDDVLAYTHLNNSLSGGVSLYLLQDGKREKWNFKSKDLDKDGLIDYIEWNIPKLLSEEIFEVEIIILNVQSYPLLGGNWTVRFNTTGTADLRIRPINGTTWDLINNSENDLEFLDVRCGEESLEYLWINETVFVEDYSCNETGSEISRVLTSGKHHLEFDFGGQIGHANNLVVSCGDTISSDAVLENSLTDCTSIALTIGANDVELDCDGYTIDGDNIDDGSIGIYATAKTGITIKNCIIKEFSKGIQLATGVSGGVHNNTIYNNLDMGIYLTQNSAGDIVIGNNTIYGTSGGDGRGIYIYRNNDNITIYNNTIHDNANYAIISGAVSGSNKPNGINIVDNRIYNSAGAGENLYLNNIKNSTIEGNSIFNALDIGMYLYAAQNMTIKNNSFYNNTNTGLRTGGIISPVFNTTNLTIINNSFYSSVSVSSSGAYIYQTANNLFEDNNFYDNAFYGILISIVHNSNFTNNTIYTTDDSQNYGISMNTAENNTFSGNNIQNHTVDEGIKMDSAARYNNITDNFISGNGDAGIFLNGADNNTFRNNNISNSTSIGYQIWSNSLSNKFYNDEIAGSGQNGIYIYNNADGNYFENLTIRENAAGGSSSRYNLYIYSNVDNTVFKSTDIYGAGGTVNIRLRTGLTGTKFIDSDVTDDTTDFILDVTAGNNVTFLNTTYSDHTHTSGTIVRQWYEEVHVNLSDGSDLENANVSIYNVTDVLFFDGLTDATGYIVRQNLTEYDQSGASTFGYMTNYTVNASHGDYGFLNESVNLTTNTITTLTFTAVASNNNPADPSITINSTEGNNYTTEDLNCFATITDEDGDAMNVTVRWYNNTILHLTDNYNNDYESGSQFNASLGYLNTTEGESWKCGMQLTDGELTSNWTNSSSLIIVDNINPGIDFGTPTPANNTVTSDNYVQINVSINDTSLEDLKFDWNGVNYTFYDDSLILMFNLDNISEFGENGSIVKDMSQKGNNGTIQEGTVWNSSGRYKGAYNFGGTTNISAPDLDDSLDLVDNFTLMAWVKWDGGPPENYPGIISKSESTSASNYILATWLKTREVYFTYFNGGFVDVRSGIYVKDNEWSFVAVTIDGNNIRFIIDGVSDNETKASALVAGTGPLRVGMAGTAYNQFFNGTIDEVRVWNRTMGVAEMKQHYYSNLHKYDNGKWALFVNETNLSRSTYQYQSSASDSEGNSNNTERRTITIGNAIPPDFTNIVLNSTNATNLTSENLTVYFTPNTDGDKDQVFNITDWRKNASSIAVLNMPFETNYSGVQGNVRDYTTYENNGTLGNSTTTTQPTWITTGIGGGAYSFNGAINEQFISIPDDNTLDVTGAISVEAWVYKDADKNWAGIVTKGSGAVEGDAGASSYLLREDDNQAAQFQISDSGDTRYSATTVSKLSTGGWYHLVGVYNTTHVLIYLNGTLTVGDAFTGSVRASTADVMIGHDFYYVVRGFAGRIDNIRVYNHSLSTAQVLANYEAGADNHSVQTITSQETTKGENWTVALTPTDNIDDGNTSISNYVIIENSAPDHVNLSSPEAGNTTTDRTPTLTWLDGVDDDEDNLSYSLLVDNDEDFSSPAIEIETSSTTYTPTTDLDLDIMYYWKVNATDGEAGSAYSDVWNFTVNSYVSVSLINNTVDFGSMIRSTTDNTTDDSPYPFVVENDGNSLINISINATPLFDSVAMGSNYQFRIDNHTEAGSFNWTTSITTWTNMLTSQVVAIDALKYDDASDTAQCEILVDVPSDEIAGGKASNVLFEAGLAE